jgi:hypothetical protein
MKTLSEAVQAAIVSEAGSTYRNIILSVIRDGNLAETEKVMAFATTITENYIKIVLNSLTNKPQRSDEAFLKELGVK